jgi:hypothetical protein
MQTIRSFAASTFIVGQGIEPIGVDAETGLFIFDGPEVRAALAKYRDIVDRLTEMQEAAAPRRRIPAHVAAR